MIFPRATSIYLRSAECEDTENITLGKPWTWTRRYFQQTVPLPITAPSSPSLRCIRPGRIIASSCQDPASYHLSVIEEEVEMAQTSVHQPICADGGVSNPSDERMPERTHELQLSVVISCNFFPSQAKRGMKSVDCDERPSLWPSFFPSFALSLSPVLGTFLITLARVTAHVNQDCPSLPVVCPCSPCTYNTNARILSKAGETAASTYRGLFFGRNFPQSVEVQKSGSCTLCTYITWLTILPRMVSVAVQTKSASTYVCNR